MNDTYIQLIEFLDQHGTYISFATPEIAERLAGSVAGTTLPFSFNP